MYVFTNPSAQAGYDTKSIFKWNLSGVTTEFPLSLTGYPTKAEETSLPHYLPIAWGRIIGFIPFQRVSVLCEMQSALSKILTHVAVSTSHDSNHYTMGTSMV